jgi:hypothetical protein
LSSVYRSKHSKRENKFTESLNEQKKNSLLSDQMSGTEKMINDFARNWITKKANSMDPEEIITKLVESKEGNHILKNGTSIIKDFFQKAENSIEKESNNEFPFTKIMEKLQSNVNNDKLEDVFTDNQLKEDAITMISEVLERTKQKLDEKEKTKTEEEDN